MVAVNVFYRICYFDFIHQIYFNLHFLALFFFTIPNCEKKRFNNLFPLTFLMCIVWIGSLSYLVAWMITIVGGLNIWILNKWNGFEFLNKFSSIGLGDTLNIPDSVMGITFLAAGTRYFFFSNFKKCRVCSLQDATMPRTYSGQYNNHAYAQNIFVLHSIHKKKSVSALLLYRPRFDVSLLLSRLCIF